MCGEQGTGEIVAPGTCRRKQRGPTAPQAMATSTLLDVLTPVLPLASLSPCPPAQVTSLQLLSLMSFHAESVREGGDFQVWRCVIYFACAVVVVRGIGRNAYGHGQTPYANALWCHARKPQTPNCISLSYKGLRSESQAEREERASEEVV